MHSPFAVPAQVGVPVKAPAKRTVLCSVQWVCDHPVVAMGLCAACGARDIGRDSTHMNGIDMFVRGHGTALTVSATEAGVCTSVCVCVFVCLFVCVCVCLCASLGR